MDSARIPTAPWLSASWWARFSPSRISRKVMNSVSLRPLALSRTLSYSAVELRSKDWKRQKSGMLRKGTLQARRFRGSYGIPQKHEFDKLEYLT